jgi:hypothetical protein
MYYNLKFDDNFQDIHDYSTGIPAHLQISLIYSRKIGELYEEESNYRAAIPWYERTVLLAKQRLAHFLPGRDKSAPINDIGAACNSLGLAQKRTGLLA